MSKNRINTALNVEKSSKTTKNDEKPPKMPKIAKNN